MPVSSAVAGGRVVGEDRRGPTARRRARGRAASSASSTLRSPTGVSTTSMPCGAQRAPQPEVRHHRDDDRVAAQQRRGRAGRARSIAMIWSPSTSSPRSSTAITRSASPSNASPSVGAARDAPRAAAPRGCVEPQPALMLRRRARRGSRRRVAPERAQHARAAARNAAPLRSRARRAARRAARPSSASTSVRDVVVERACGARSTTPTPKPSGPRLGLARPPARASSGFDLAPRASSGELAAAGRERASRRCRRTGCGWPRSSPPARPRSRPTYAIAGRREHAERARRRRPRRRARRPARPRASGPTRACRARRRTARRRRAPGPRRDRARRRARR